jgi:hypothetical protein
MKKKFLRILIKCRMTFEFEYLCELKFIFEMSLWFESGDQMGNFDEKIEIKNLAQLYL